MAEVKPSRIKLTARNCLSIIPAFWGNCGPYRTVLATMLINMTLGIPYYYGNMVTYSASYFRNKFGEGRVDIGDEWMIPCFYFFETIGTLATQKVIKLMGVRYCMPVCCLVCTCSLFVTHVSVQTSSVLTLFTLIVLPALCSGVLMTAGLSYVTGWFAQRHLGVAVSIVMWGFCLGGVLYNPMTTAFINPDRLSPDLQEGKMMYFTQENVLERFSLVFIPIGAVTLIIQLIALACLEAPPSEVEQYLNIDLQVAKTNNTPPHGVNDTEGKGQSGAQTYEISHLQQSSCTTTTVSTSFSDTCNNNLDVELTHTPNDVNGCSLTKKKIDSLTKIQPFPVIDVKSNMPNNEETKINSVASASCLPSKYYTFEPKHICLQPDVPKQDLKEAQTQVNGTCRNNEDGSQTLVPDSHKDTIRDTTPGGLFRSFNFYAIFFSLFALSHCALAMHTYYKTYGELFIDDDRLLMSIMPVAVIEILIVRLLLGAMADRLGVKSAIVVSLSVTSVMMSFWIISAHAGKAVYVIVSSCSLAFSSLCYFLGPIATVKMFGHAHFCTNLGIVNCALCVSSVCSPVLFGYLLTTTTWFCLAFIGSCLAAAAFVFALFIKQ